MKKVLVIAGLTASGKSALGIALAKRYNGEIISADSVAVYKELDIGSAKLPFAEQGGIKHHLMDVHELSDPYNVALFQKEGRKAIDDIISRGKLPIVVGGTGLYINALLFDYRFEEEEASEEVEDPRDNETLYQDLLKRDPKAANSIHPNNRKRILRALESLDYHDQTRSEISQDAKETPLYDALVFFLQGDRSLIYERIEKRVDIMMEQGLETEIQHIVANYSDAFKYQSLQSIGYREFEAYFAGNQTLEDTISLIKRNTRRFAKRQITWFKHQTPNITIDIFDPEYKERVNDLVIQWLDK